MYIYIYIAVYCFMPCCIYPVHRQVRAQWVCNWSGVLRWRPAGSIKVAATVIWCVTVHKCPGSMRSGEVPRQMERNLLWRRTTGILRSVAAGSAQLMSLGLQQFFCLPNLEFIAKPESWSWHAWISREKSKPMAKPRKNRRTPPPRRKYKFL